MSESIGSSNLRSTQRAVPMSGLPLSYTLIEEFLYLGNVATATNESVLLRLKIKRVLTLREKGIPEDNKVSHIIYFHLPINDTQNDDILTHFQRCHYFIEEAQNIKQSVLVHCRMGVSRSATIVISYLMAKYGIHWAETLQFVRKRRKEIKPNPSFLYQLKLFDEMEFRMNPLHPSFRLFLLKRWIHVMKKKVISNSLDTDPTILDKYFSLLALSPEAEGLPFCCAKCKTLLFAEISVVRDITEESRRYQCSYIITEPQEWMLPQIGRAHV